MFNIQQKQKTEEEKALDDLIKLNDVSEGAINQFIILTTDAYNLFWENNPEIKIQLLGTKAIEVFTKSAQAQAFIKQIKPDYVVKGVPNGYEVSFNPDGSGVITEVVSDEDNQV